MKRFVFALGLVVVLLTLASAARAGERWVVVPLDDTPFTVRQNDFVRLAGETISGGNIKAEIDGPARIEFENIVTDLVEGRVLIGMLKKEFEIKPTGKGTVKVTLTMTSPIPNTKPKKAMYEFKVK